MFNTDAEEILELLQWAEAEKQKGLVDIKLVANPDATLTEIGLIREMNQINRAIAAGQFVDISDDL